MCHIWCALLLCFHGLLPISSVTVPNKHAWDTEKILTKGDIMVNPNECTLRLRHSKTNQYKERVFEAVVLTSSQSKFRSTLNLINFQCQQVSLQVVTFAIIYIGRGQTYDPHTYRCEIHLATPSQGNWP